MIFSLLILFIALCISFVAGFYSIVGLMTIFAGSAFAVAIMGSVLEVGKLAAATWLHHNWKATSFLMKSYLTTAVIVLMFITSMGIFGFLSKAHIEQTGANNISQTEIEQIEFELDQEKTRVATAQKILERLDDGLKIYFEKEYVTRGLREREKQKPERDALEDEIKEATAAIGLLNSKKFEIVREQKQFEVEVGPIKYVADLIYGEEKSEQNLDAAVRYMILLLIFVFDPLAVVLVLAANSSLSRARQRKEKPRAPVKSSPEDSLIKSTHSNTDSSPQEAPEPLLVEVEVPTIVEVEKPVETVIEKIVEVPVYVTSSVPSENAVVSEAELNSLLKDCFLEADNHPSMSFNLNNNSVSILNKIIIRKLKEKLSKKD